MALILMPSTPGIRRLEVMAAVPATQVSRSTWTGRQKVVTLSQATRFRARVTINPTYDRSASKKWRGFLMMTQGQANVFDIPMDPQTHAHAEMVVNGAHSQGATTLAVDGMTPNESYLETGDYLTLTLTDGTRQLVTTIEPVFASGGGSTSLDFYPAARGDIADNVAVNSRNPYMRVALADDEPEWSQGPNGEFTLPAFEVEEVY